MSLSRLHSEWEKGLHDSIEDVEQEVARYISFGKLQMAISMLQSVIDKSFSLEFLRSAVMEEDIPWLERLLDKERGSNMAEKVFDLCTDMKATRELPPGKSLPVLLEFMESNFDTVTMSRFTLLVPEWVRSYYERGQESCVEALLESVSRHEDRVVNNQGMSKATMTNWCNDLEKRAMGGR